MQRLKFINSRGQEAVFDSVPPLIFWKVDGLSVPPVTSISTQAGGQDGYTLRGILLEARTISLSCHIHGKDGVRNMYDERRRLNAICSPTLGPGELVYTNDTGSFRAVAFCREIAYSTKANNLQTLDVTFECPLPFLEEANQSEVRLAYVEGGLRFPIVTSGFFGTMGYETRVDNSGDVPTPITLLIDGVADTPRISNVTTGEFIEVAKGMEPGDKLFINTDPEHLEVSIIRRDPKTQAEIRENAFGYLTGDSSLFHLAMGSNLLKFQSVDGNKRVKILINYRKRYIGV